MKKKILIYGYGWVGESAYEFFRYFGFRCNVIDDDLDFSKLAFFNEDFNEDIDVLGFDFYVVAIYNKSTAVKLKDKLLKLGVDEDKIKNFQSEKYTKNMEYLLDSYFADDFMEYFGDGFWMPMLHKTLENVIDSHYRMKRSDELKIKRLKYDETNQASVFSKILDTSYKHSSGSPILYPGFYVYNSDNKFDDNDFYFIEKIDFEKLRNRHKDIKLIACFGNSALRVEYLPSKDSITGNMQQILDTRFGLNKYMVINFGIGGSGVYDQLLLFNAICFSLKPDIVISFFGGTELRNGLYCCDTLVKKHNMVYIPEAWEEPYKASVSGNIPLFREMSKMNDGSNPNLNINDVIEAVNFRLNQFNSYVSAGGGGHFTPLFSRLVF